MTEKDACVLFVASMSFLSFIRYLLECVNIEHGLLLSLAPLSALRLIAVTHTHTHSVHNFCINFQTKNNSLVVEHSTHYCNYKPPQATTVQLLVPSHLTLTPRQTGTWTRCTDASITTSTDSNGCESVACLVFNTSVCTTRHYSLLLKALRFFNRSKVSVCAWSGDDVHLLLSGKNLFNTHTAISISTHLSNNR